MNNSSSTKEEMEEQLSYYERNKEHCKQNARSYQKKNKEYYQQYWISYYAKNKSQLLIKRREYARKLREKKKQVFYTPKPEPRPEIKDTPIVLQPITVEESQPPIVIQQGNFTVSFS